MDRSDNPTPPRPEKPTKTEKPDREGKGYYSGVRKPDQEDTAPAT